MTDDKDEWQADASLTITVGHLDICSIVKITETVQAYGNHWIVQDTLGVYTRTEKWYNGRPVYIKDNQYLHVGNDGNWSVGDQIGSYYIKSTGAPLSPVDAKKWYYQYRNEDNPADISVKCNY